MPEQEVVESAKESESVEITAEEAAEIAEKAAESSTVSRPQWLPEKFKSPEDMAKAYSELEKKLGSKPKAEPEKKSGIEIVKPPEEAGEGSEETEETPIPQEMHDLLSAATENFNATGKIDDALYAAFEKKGLSREVVDQFRAGAEALRAKYEGEVYDLVGGKDEYATLSKWAAKNLSQERLDRYNQLVTSGDSESAKMAVMALQKQYADAEGANPTLIEGGSGGSTAASFQSWDEVTAAMRDPKYKTSPSYRKQIEDRLAVSDLSVTG